MYSVVLTELGISVFKDNKFEKSFSFSNPVKDYLSVKNKEAKLNELLNFLTSLHRGVVVSDEVFTCDSKKEFN